jgi:hypothetical protein
LVVGQEVTPAGLRSSFLERLWVPVRQEAEHSDQVVQLLMTHSASVGATVGLRVGDGVGFWVGSGVGWRVGLRVATGVGVWVGQA